MIRLNNKSGFTLIEVLLATALVGIALGPIYFLQNTMFNRVMRKAEEIERMFIAYDFFLSQPKKEPSAKIEPKKVSKTVDHPKTQLTYEIKDVPKDSVLYKDFEHLYIEKVSWTWSVLGTSYNDVFVHIVFEPPSKKEAQEPEQKEQQGTKEEPKKSAMPDITTPKQQVRPT